MNLMERTDGALRTVTRFAGLNLTWLLFVVLGLGVMGLFPATAALFHRARLWVLGEYDEPMLKDFWYQYKRRFLSANLAGWSFSVIGVLLYLNFEVIRASEGSVPLYMVLPFIALTTLFVLLVSAILPVSLHCAEGSRDALKKTLFFVLGRLPVALLFPAVIWAVVWLCLVLPAFFLFFSGSVSAYALMWLFVRSFEKLSATQPLTQG
ncbi:MAG: DUF624 domain-containing protein [Saccharospirillum sp.]|uniref:YesL family protein n=1 Tax=Saccharospirillum sp. TaxID=2033801 RepID=UPI003297EAB8